MLDEKSVDEEIATGAKNSDAGIMDVALGLDPNIGVLSFQIVLKDDTKVDDGSWKRTR